jgi:hypothetical protein
MSVFLDELRASEHSVFEYESTEAQQFAEKTLVLAVLECVFADKAVYRQQHRRNNNNCHATE